MTKYRFTPNALCTMLFGTVPGTYKGDGVVALMEAVLGPPTARRYLIAQDVFCGGISRGKITAYVGSGLPVDNDLYVVIGEMEKLETP